MKSPADIIALAHDKYSHSLFKHCCYRRFSREDSEELVQEAFLSVWEYLDNGKEIENLKAFLYQVLNNLIVDRVRKGKLERKISLDALQEQGFDLEERDRKDETLKLQERFEARKILKALKDSGSKEEHDLLRMRYIHGLMPSDIASKTGVSSNTISVRLHRAIKKVTSFLDRN